MNNNIYDDLDDYCNNDDVVGVVHDVGLMIMMVVIMMMVFMMIMMMH